MSPHRGGSRYRCPGPRGTSHGRRALSPPWEQKPVEWTPGQETRILGSQAAAFSPRLSFPSLAPGKSLPLQPALTSEPEAFLAGPLELGLSEPRPRCGERDKVESATSWTGRHALPTDSSAGLMQHARSPTPGRPPLPVSPAAPHVWLNSSSARTRGRQGGTGGSDSRAHPQSPSPSIRAQSLAALQATEEGQKLTSCCWFCLQGTKLSWCGIQPLASAGEGGDTLCGPGAVPGPYQPQESQHLEDLGCPLSARPWRLQGYFSDLGEDSSLCPAGTPGSR